jgi:predicted negative regulator of RcsB-dependent stress response
VTEKDMDDNSWLSERTKTIIVSVIMTILFVGMFWGYYEAHQWRAERNQIIEETNE